jgi:hypothetical protein
VLSHFGIGLERLFLLWRGVADSVRGLLRFIVILPRKLDRLWLFVADLDSKRAARGRDAQIPSSKSSHEIERFPGRLLERKPPRVLLHRALDRRPDLRRSPEESICRDEPSERLMRTVKVIGLDEELEATHAVREVCEDRLRQKFIPERLPKALYFSERLRMMWPTLDVVNSLPAQLVGKLGLASPRRVLSTLVRQNLLGHAVSRDPASERFHDQRRFLMVADRVGDEEARVVVEKRGHVDALLAPQQEGEDVGLPELVRCGSFEAHRLGLLLLPPLAGLRDETFLVKNTADGPLGQAESCEAFEDVTNPAGPVLRVLAPNRRHRFFEGSGLFRAARSPGWPPLESLVTLRLVPLDPVLHRRAPDSQKTPDVGVRGAVIDDLTNRPLPHLEWVRHRRRTPSLDVGA